MTTGLLPWEESPDSDKLTWIYVFRTLDLVFRCLWSEVSKPNHSFRCLWNVSYITCITITGSIPLVEQELLALPEHLSSPRVFSGIRVTRSLVLCVCFVYCCLSFFLAIVLYVLLRFTDSDYPFGIFKPFSAIGLLVPEGIIRSVASAALTWIIRYIFVSNYIF